MNSYRTKVNGAAALVLVFSFLITPGLVTHGGKRREAKRPNTIRASTERE